MSEAATDPMSPAQRDAICKAWSLLGEHFEQVLLVVNWECDGDQGEVEEAHEGYWHGGAMANLGMAHFAADRILHSGRKYHDPDGKSQNESQD